MSWLLAICLPALLMMAAFFVLSLRRINSSTFQHDSPTVAVLLAVRNEEDNILACLKALDKLSYSEEHLEIIIGDDASTDKTTELITQFIEGKKNFHYHYISEQKYGLKAKANVLEQLVEKTDATYLFITDADIEVPVHWIQNMLKQFDEETGVVTGVTAISGDSLFSKLQNIDWLFALGLAHVLSGVNVPVTCMGNNMAVKKMAFDSVGGYREIGFSVTEDFKLFRALIDKGWGFKNLYSKGVLAYSKPIGSVMGLLKQRQRWMKGGLENAFLKILPLMAFPVFYLAVTFGLFVEPKLFLSILGIMAVLKAGIAFVSLKKINKQALIVFIPLYELYALLLMVIMVFYLPFSGKVNWKARRL